MLQFLNILFLLIHAFWVLFVCAGWMWERTRLLHLVAVALTALSWFVMGIWYGWGYCICTDWHWTVRQKLGFHDVSDSYIHFLLLKLTGINFNQDLVEKATLAALIIALTLSIWLNIRDYKRK